MKKLVVSAIPTLIFLCIISWVNDYFNKYDLNLDEEKQLEGLIIVLFAIAVLFAIPILIQLRRVLKFHKRKRAVLRMVERGNFQIMFLNESNRNWPVREILTEYNPDAEMDYARFLFNLYMKKGDRKITQIPSWSLVVKCFPEDVQKLSLT